MADADARAYLLEAFELRGLSPSPAELQIVGAIGRFEGRYGSWGNGSNNWGAIQCKSRPPCPADCFQHGDSSPETGKYQACFRRYDSAAEGAADLIRELYRRRGVPEGARAGSAHAVALAMYQSGYYEGHGKTPEARVRNYAKAIAANAATIAKSLGEPLHVTDGPGPGPSPFPGSSSSSGGGKGLGLAVLGLIALRLAQKGAAG